MSFNHSPADIIRSLLTDLGLGINTDVGTGTGEEEGDWPITVSQMPDAPDQYITIYDTTGKGDNRNMINGEWDEHSGIQIKVRSYDRTDGYVKMSEIGDALDTEVVNTTVTIDGTGYNVQSISTGSINFLGKEPGTGRLLFTLNAVASIQLTT